MPIFEIVVWRFRLFIATSECENHLLVIIITQCTMRHYFFGLINSILWKWYWFAFKLSHILRLRDINVNRFRRSKSQRVQLTFLTLTVHLAIYLIVLAPNRSFREPLSKWTRYCWLFCILLRVMLEIRNSHWGSTSRSHCKSCGRRILIC